MVSKNSANRLSLSCHRVPAGVSPLGTEDEEAQLLSTRAPEGGDTLLSSSYARNHSVLMEGRTVAYPQGFQNLEN